MNNTNQQAAQTSPHNGPAYKQQGQAGQQPQQNQDQQRQAQGGREVTSAEKRRVDQSTRAQAPALLPPVDIFEDENGFTLIADLPGVSKDQLVVRVNGDQLLIEGAAAVPASANVELLYGEIQTPQYRRSFTLSRELDPSHIEAKLNNGVLNLRIPKSEEAKPRRIEVSVG